MRSLRFVLPLLATCALVALVTPGCQGRECEGSYVEFGNKLGEGSFVGADTWQTSPTDSAWLDFPGQRTYGLFVPAWATEQRVTLSEQAFVSNDNRCDTSTPPICNSNVNWALAAGNLAEFQAPGPPNVGYIQVHNDTCAHFYLRVVLTAEPARSSPSDAGPDGADATPDSAAGDASSG